MTIATEPQASAEEAGLHYVTDDHPGIRRVRRGRGFGYLKADGSPVDAGHREWIRSLAIPPAWTDVWICPDRRGHLQATGRDARRRKQYRYHPGFRATRDETKFERLLAFGRALPGIRRRVARDLRRRGLPRAKVVAAVVALLDRTLLRVGNEEYARQNRSFGLTTLRNRHANVDRGEVRFRFRGKSGKVQEASVNDRRLARIVERLQDLPGQELFQYLDDDGEPRSIGSEDVNDYLREASGDDFTAKDFRTWAGTMLAAWALRDTQDGDAPAGRRRPTRRHVARAIASVAERLGNTPAVSRNAYVHPEVIGAYLEGEVVRDTASDGAPPRSRSAGRLTPDEAAVVRLLRRRAQAASRRARARR